jgi:hypothetical protein
MATGTLYVRIDEDLLEWIREQSGVTGVPMARVTEALLRWALEHGACLTGRVEIRSGPWVCGRCQEARHDDCRDKHMCHCYQQGHQ